MKNLIKPEKGLIKRAMLLLDVEKVLFYFCFVSRGKMVERRNRSESQKLKIFRFDFRSSKFLGSVS
jgi:hypothetical protein